MRSWCVAAGLLIAAAAQAVPAVRAVPAPSASPADDGQWTMPAKNYASTRYSALAGVTTQNVGRLSVDFTFSTGIAKGHEAAPLVVGSTMFIVSPFPNIVYALDLSKPGAPTKWSFKPKPVAASQGVACCDVVNRGAMYWQGRVIFNTLDGQTIALDANTGRPAWRAVLADINKGETITMAPLVAHGKVLVGVSGGEFGVRGWLAALDAGTGKLAWKAFHTGPDKDALIGPDFKPFYPMDRGRDLGVKSWPPEAWKIGGGTMWGWISYDPALNLIFYGTANPGPWNAEQRPGDNKWTNTVFARDADTGQARWAYQTIPHDTFDHDGVNELLLLDVPVHGRMVPAIVRPERNGYLYVIDRRNGQVLSADKYWANGNAYLGVDLKTGRLKPNKDKVPEVGRVTRNICPTAPGAKDWNPSAFSPRTGLIYIPHMNLCMDWQNVQTSYIAGTPYVGADVKMYAGPGGNRGEFTAWDPVARKAAWNIPEDLPLWSGALATGGDLVFYGTLDGWFKAIDARTGKLLWRFKCGSGIIGQPISYRAPDGRQHIAVLAGVGGWAGVIVSANLDPGDPTAGLGYVGAVPDLKAKTTAGGMLYDFALPR
jgi:PQQ-dependent dehydrogenase (methanol/ethanol family)